MAIAVVTTRQSMADHYGSLGTFIGVATGDPGSAAAPANEATGGTPAYTRVATVWTPGSDGSLAGSAVTVDVPPATYSHIILAAAATGDQVDNADVADVVISAQGQLVVTPTYTQT
jgi:hypothetical protein